MQTEIAFPKLYIVSLRSPKLYIRAWQPRAQGISRSPNLENGAKNTPATPRQATTGT